MTSPSQTDHKSEEQAIRKLTNQWFAAERQRDLERSLSFLSPEVVLQAEGAPEMKGLEAARQLWQGFFAMPFIELVEGPRVVTVAQSADLACDAGEWQIVLPSGEGKSELPAKSVIVWQKQSGEWKAIALSFSLNIPRDSQE